MSSSGERGVPAAAARFATTRWSVVLAAGGDDDETARVALSDLCERYWYPAYAYARRRGHGPEEARDLTQGFFTELLRRGDLAVADPARGRFRAFLTTALAHHLSNARAAERAEKRGGGRPTLSLDLADAEGRFHLEPEDTRSPESVLTAAWAREVLDRAFHRLADREEAQARGELFRELSPYLGPVEERESYAEIARRLGTTEGALKVAAHRLRGRFREVLLEEIGETVSGPEEVDLELSELFRALAAENPGRAG